MKRRIKAVLILFSFLFSVLLYRCLDIGVLHQKNFGPSNVNLIERSVAQRTFQFRIDNGRGKILDRNGKLLSAAYTPKVILFPFLKSIDWPIEKLSAITGVSEYDIKNQFIGKKEPFTLKGISNELTSEKIDQINNLHVSGLISMLSQDEDDQQLAEHLVGIARENKEQYEKQYESDRDYKPKEFGVIGLEAQFEDFLKSDGTSNLMLHVDNLGKPMFGNEVKYAKPSNPFYPVSLETTIDKDLQQILEQAVNQAKLQKGAAVLIDVKTNKLLAMVSRPSMNYQNLFSQNDNTATNFALQPSTPGSVFKTVVAAAAIDQGIVQDKQMYNCDKDLRGNYEKDEDKRKGNLTFQESFYASCNYTFGLLGQKLSLKNKDMFEMYANKLGMNGPVGWTGSVYHEASFSQFQNEGSSTFFGGSKPLEGLRNTSIGQKDVKVTPLAVANMMSTIARGGSPKQVKVVDSVLYKNGTEMFAFENQTLTDDYLSPDSMQQLREMLRGVITSEKGTGRRYSSLPYTLAGKSGTAETKKEKDKITEQNKWFAGYFPYEKPRYAFAVVSLNVKDEITSTSDTVTNLVKSIYQYDKTHKN
ncbi:peptidoglycan D,D-transpeptidase FtsI family protein [Gottfriedia solisilvae]|uniref:serine-type D-Ala-D-Ala carboxypeptidase n=1 Tax=Gottfriedia solisilvae TaxID=1516104 RepID=A0A8J3AEK3_9BACI|nr:penicillin-binding protein 2 [Gottfriedia solisilvae]GGI10634.1 penicillin-binding protein [Gottfriedia solisilvae]